MDVNNNFAVEREMKGVERPIKKKKNQHLTDKFCNKDFAVKREMKRHKKNVHLSNGNSKAVEKLILEETKTD